MKTIVVTQPYVPAYRVPLFNAIEKRLEKFGYSLRVVSSAPRGGQSARGDRSTGAWHREIAARSVPVGKWRIEVRSLPRSLRHPALIVSELEALNALGWMRSFSSTPLILWGHGKGFVNTTGGLADHVEWALAKRAAHVMTYSPAGRQFLIEQGNLAPERVTAIGNSTDTAVLRAESVRFREQNLTTKIGGAALYVGGLDASKRVGFLLDAYEEALRVDPMFELTVVGKGVDEALVRAAAAKHERLRYIPEARDGALAELGARVDALWVPGRVGLVAVDALAMGLPVHTTDFGFHAPEIDFLRDDEVYYLGPTAREYAIESLQLMREKSVPVFRDAIPTIDSVADAFVGVVVNALRGEGR